jgi:hypothetical protein
VQNADTGVPKAEALGAAATSSAGAEQPPLPLRGALRALADCAWRMAVLLVQGRIRQPADNRGRWVAFADGTSAAIYRETVIDRPPPASPAVLVVGFRLRRIGRGWVHALFRLESELNTVLFAGFPGLVSKLWLRHDQCHLYRGLYQWDSPELAVAYVRALWWALALVSERESIHYAILPGLTCDEVLANPAVIDQRLDTAPEGWWRPSGQAPQPR